MNLEQKIQQQEDRLAIKKLVDDYAFFADTRNTQGQMNLFTEQTNFEVFYDPTSTTATEIYTGREALFPVFDNLHTYDRTMHFVGQCDIHFTAENQATANVYCIAHHWNFVEEQTKLMVAYLRYHDRFSVENGKWLFSERKIIVDCIEQR